MKTVLITPCTNRKRCNNGESTIGIDLLPRENQDAVTTAWINLVRQSASRVRAEQLYAGRGFSEAIATLESGNVELWVISAGMGLINKDKEIPRYNLTTSSSVMQNIQQTITDGVFCHKTWWDKINQSLNNGFTINGLIQKYRDHLIVLTLSSEYLKLVIEDLKQIKDEDLHRLRILGLSTKDLLPKKIKDYWMPYDYRFDGPSGPLRGTKSDYPQRTARHFIQSILTQLPNKDASTHRQAVVDFISTCQPQPRVTRAKEDDKGIKERILMRWADANGNSSRMLRIIRDEELIQCEQSRFARIFNSIKQREQQ